MRITCGCQGTIEQWNAGSNSCKSPVGRMATKLGRVAIAAARALSYRSDNTLLPTVENSMNRAKIWTMMKSPATAFCGCIGMLASTTALATGVPEPATSRPVLAELFTSESCSSCPPADALLRQLAVRSDVLPLSFHVGYWDGPAWTDRFASPLFTARQKDYASAHHWGVYTPQLVVDGRIDVVGSDRAAVSGALQQAHENASGAAITIAHTAGELNVSIGAVTGAAAPAGADVYLISFDSAQQTQVRGGENAGASLSHANVVRSMRKIGDWSNHPKDLRVSLGPDEIGDRYAVLIQDASGTVWGLASSKAL